MFEYITGPLNSLTPTAAIVEAAGVGYFINISLQTHRAIDGAATAKLYIHTYALQQEPPVLYGFASTTEREMFRLLVSISGVGANTARIMLSTHSTEDLATMIATSNVTAIQKTKGIGVKTAERVVLELKSKVLNVIAVNPSEDGSTNISNTTNAANLEEAMAALLVLGFNRAAIEKVAKKIYAANPDISPEDIIREALAKL